MRDENALQIVMQAREPLSLEPFTRNIPAAKLGGGRQAISRRASSSLAINRR